jgi:hypothetical protein
VMTNYAKTPDERPWARDLCSGDFLSEVQANCVCAVRLSDFDMHLRPFKSGYQVEFMTVADHREQRANSCGARGFC